MPVGLMDGLGNQESGRILMSDQIRGGGGSLRSGRVRNDISDYWRHVIMRVEGDPESSTTRTEINEGTMVQASNNDYCRDMTSLKRWTTPP